MIKINAIDRVGLFTEEVKLYTNDPRHADVALRLTANSQALPEFVKRITNANVTTGEMVGAFQMWPTAKPETTVARNARTNLAIRIKPTIDEPLELKMVSDKSGQVAYRLRREGTSNVYWLDIETEPIAEPGLKQVKILLQSLGPRVEEIALSLTLRVLDDSILFTPAVVDCGSLSLANWKTGALRVGRAGVRKSAGTFRVKTATSTLDFLKPEVLTIVDGSNYLLNINTVAERLPKAGTYEGKLIVETDDPQKPRLEIPVKIVLSDK
jgi:hypothetical protein